MIMSRGPPCAASCSTCHRRGGKSGVLRGLREDATAWPTTSPWRHRFDAGGAIRTHRRRRGRHPFSPAQVACGNDCGDIVPLCRPEGRLSTRPPAPGAAALDFYVHADLFMTLRPSSPISCCPLPPASSGRCCVSASRSVLPELAASARARARQGKRQRSSSSAFASTRRRRRVQGHEAEDDRTKVRPWSPRSSAMFPTGSVLRRQRRGPILVQLASLSRRRPRGPVRHHLIFDLAVRLGLGEHFWNGELRRHTVTSSRPAGLSLEALRAEPRGIRVPLITRYAKHAERPGGIRFSLSPRRFRPGIEADERRRGCPRCRWRQGGRLDELEQTPPSWAKTRSRSQVTKGWQRIATRFSSLDLNRKTRLDTLEVIHTSPVTGWTSSA